MGNTKAFANTQLLRYLRSLVPDSKHVARGNIVAATKEVIGEFQAAVQDQAKEIKKLRRALSNSARTQTELEQRNADLEAKLGAATEPTQPADVTEGDVVNDEEVNDPENDGEPGQDTDNGDDDEDEDDAEDDSTADALDN